MFLEKWLRMHQKTKRKALQSTEFLMSRNHTTRGGPQHHCNNLESRSYHVYGKNITLIFLVILVYFRLVKFTLKRFFLKKKSQIKIFFYCNHIILNKLYIFIYIKFFHQEAFNVLGWRQGSLNITCHISCMVY